MAKVKRALLSVSSKEGIVEFARGLHELGIELISTGGTAGKLREAGLPVKDVSEITKFPEMMNGRVKTLHPAIHGGILAVRSNQEHMKQLAEQEFKPLDLVACNLYPFAATIAKEGVTLDEAIEQIDIGGPSMVRSAAKNFKDVVVIVDPERYSSILEQLNNNGDIDYQTRLGLAHQAFQHTAGYDHLIQEYLNKIIEEDEPEKEIWPEVFRCDYIKKSELRYGENPHQKAAFYQIKNPTEPSVATARQLSGKELSFNNINDTDGALELIKEFKTRPAAAVIKHANPCGAAIGDSLFAAYTKAHAGDPLSAFGSIVALNQIVTADVASEMSGKDKFIEVVIAPEYTAEALKILQERWKNIRLLMTGELYANKRDPEYDLKKVVGGLLVQERDLIELDEKELKFVTDRKPSAEEIRDMLFSWKVVKHIKSNAIVMVKDEMVVGVGAGQMSRVDSMIIAGRKAEGRQKGGVVASDAFFPFPDAIEEAAARGITAIIQPGGSVRDEMVIEEANKHDLAMVFTGRRHFRH